MTSTVATITSMRKRCLDRIGEELSALPQDEDALLKEMKKTHGRLFDPVSYGLE